METENSANPFHIVGIGASADGLEYFEQFFRHLPANSGMAGEPQMILLSIEVIS